MKTTQIIDRGKWLLLLMMMSVSVAGCKFPSSSPPQFQGSISGHISIPSGVSLSPANVTIVAGVNGSFTPGSDGDYKLIINPKAPVLAAALTSNKSPLLLNIFDSASTSNDLNVTTTAVTMVFMCLGLYTTDPASWTTLEGTISSVPAVQSFASTLVTKLAEDPDILSANPPDADIVASLDNALAASAAVIGSSIAQYAARMTRSLSAANATVDPQSASGLSLSVDLANRLIATNSKLRYVEATVSGPLGSSADTLVIPCSPPVRGLKASTTVLNPSPLGTPLPGTTLTYTVRARGGLSNANGLYNASADGIALLIAMENSGVVNIALPLISVVLGAPVPTDTIGAADFLLKHFTVPITNFAQNLVSEGLAGSVNFSALMNEFLSESLAAFASDWPDLAAFAATYLASQITQAEIANCNPVISVLCHAISLLTNGSKATVGVIDMVTTDMVDVYSVKLTAPGGMVVLYVTNSASNNVSGFLVNESTGALTPISGSPFLAGSSPSIPAVDRTHRFLYVPNQNSSRISGYSINQANGALTPVPGSPFSAGSGPNMAYSNPVADFLYIVNGNDYTISAYSINATTGALTLVFTTAPIGDQPEWCTMTPNGTFLYADNTVTGKVTGFAVNNSTGALTQLGGSPFTSVLCPHQVVVDPTGHFLYVTNNTPLGGVGGFSIDPSTGALSSLAGSPFASGGWLQPIVVDPLGRYVYAQGNPGGTNPQISGYALNETTGALANLSGFPISGGNGGMAFDPSANFLFTANGTTGNNTVSSYGVSASTGALSQVAGSPFAAGTGTGWIAVTTISGQ